MGQLNEKLQEAEERAHNMKEERDLLEQLANETKLVKKKLLRSQADLATARDAHTKLSQDSGTQVDQLQAQMKTLHEKAKELNQTIRQYEQQIDDLERKNRWVCCRCVVVVSALVC